jgi:hypothetical protein
VTEESSPAIGPKALPMRASVKSEAKTVWSKPRVVLVSPKQGVGAVILPDFDSVNDWAYGRFSGWEIAAKAYSSASLM